MRIRKFTKSNEGVVGIVVAVLLIGLLVSVVSLLQYMYVPKWMEKTEAEHMDHVLTQFSELKFAIDTQIANSLTDTPIATSITLGSEKLPFLMSMRAFGSLGIFSKSCNIIIDYNFESNTYSKTINLGTIRYTSANAYYIPEEKQTYIYEAGAIITSQTSGNSISIKPSFKFVKDPDNKIFFNLSNITGVGEKITYGGYDTIPIQTEYFINDLNVNFINDLNVDLSISDVNFLKIETSCPKAWFVYLKSSLEVSGFIDGTDFTIAYDDVDVQIDFINPNTGDKPVIEFYINDIYGQIGPGWVE